MQTVNRNAEEIHTKLTSRALVQRHFYAFLFALPHCRIRQLYPLLLDSNKNLPFN